MLKDEKVQIRIASELIDYCKKNYSNVSLFIRDAIREKIQAESGKDSPMPFVEIRAKSLYNYSATLEKVIDGDTSILEFDLGFFIKSKIKVRLAGINCPEINTLKGEEAKAFVKKELKNANLIVETRKREKYGRFLALIYYSKKYQDFEDIIRNGKILNEELLKAGLAEKYDD